MRRLLFLLLALACAPAQAAFIPNAVTTNALPNALGVLTNNGTGGIGFSTNIAQTLVVNNLTTTNLTVVNQLTVSNIVVTNVSIVNSLTVKGKAVSFTSVNGTNVNQLNLKDSASTTWTYDGTSNVTAVAASGGVTTVVTPLAYSGTNITGFDCTTNNATFTLLLTNHCLFGTSTFTGLPNTTTNLFFTLALKQDSAGAWVPKFTNSILAWADGVQPVVKTNANALSYLYFHTHLFTNGMLVGTPNINVQ